MRTIRVATRTSKLATIQAQLVADGLRRSGARTDIVGITTTGDRHADSSLASLGGDGAFTKELERALLDGRADVAVHSMKDLPTTLAPGLVIGGVLEREDARDVLVSTGNAYRDFASLPAGAVVGTSSARRQAFVAAARSDVVVRPLRGNVETRVRNVTDGTFDAAVLALAGLKRAGLLHLVDGGSPLAIEASVPAAGQGAICIQCRAADDDVATIAAALNHSRTSLATSMERAFLRRAGGGCLVPIGVHAVISGTAWRVVAAIAAVDGSAAVRRTAEGRFASEAQAVAAVEGLADEMLASGGRTIVDHYRAPTTRES